MHIDFMLLPSPGDLCPLEPAVKEGPAKVKTDEYRHTHTHTQTVDPVHLQAVQDPQSVSCNRNTAVGAREAKGPVHSPGRGATHRGPSEAGTAQAARPAA